MYYKVIKSSFDGLSGGNSLFKNIEGVLEEIHISKGWSSLEELRNAIREWARYAQNGDVFCTQVTVIIALKLNRKKT